MLQSEYSGKTESNLGWKWYIGSAKATVLIFYYKWLTGFPEQYHYSKMTGDKRQVYIFVKQFSNYMEIIFFVQLKCSLHPIIHRECFLLLWILLMSYCYHVQERANIPNYIIWSVPCGLRKIALYPRKWKSLICNVFDSPATLLVLVFMMASKLLTIPPTAPLYRYAVPWAYMLVPRRPLGCGTRESTPMPGSWEQRNISSPIPRITLHIHMPCLSKIILQLVIKSSHTRIA